MKTLVFVHSYCLSAVRSGDGRCAPYRLTRMSAEAMRIGIQTLKKRGATHIIVSTAYNTWKHEARLLKDLATAEGVDPNRLRVIAEVTDSYDDALKSCALARSLGAGKILVIAEKWHASRSRKAFAWAGPDLQIEVIPFKSPLYETALEPSLIKSVRAGNLLLWIAWNALLSCVPISWLRKNRSLD